MDDKSDSSTLKQKWKHHWQKEKPLSSVTEQANVSGVLFFWVFSFSLMFTLLLVAIPHHHRDNLQYKLWSVAVLCFIFFECIFNWLLCVAKTGHTSSTTVKHNHTNGLPPDWKNCLVCQVDAPPRSHHCRICNACVLKRDFHCFFTGVCVGFRNQRNFVVYTLYVFIGCIYGAYLLSHYLGHFYEIRSHEGWAFVPVVAAWKLVTGNMNLTHFILLVEMYICILMAVVSAYVLAWEMSVIIAGRTTYEVRIGLKKYKSKSVFDNLRSVFGPYWLIQLLLPFPTELPSDGTVWETTNEMKWQ